MQHKPSRPPRLVVIGVSTGGPEALNQVIPLLPADFHLPVVIVQHMPEKFTKIMADGLNHRSSVAVCEAHHGQELEAGKVYIAPGGFQMALADGPAYKLQLVLTHDPPVHHCKPSVDYFLSSAIKVLGGAILAVIMTGMGADGASSLLALKEHGGMTLAQDPASCVVNGMPQAAVNLGAVREVVPLGNLTGRICHFSHRWGQGHSSGHT